MKVAILKGQENTMAHIGKEEYLMVWPDDLLPPAALQRQWARLLEDTEVAAGEDSPVYLQPDWFGPFLFGPANRVMGGEC